MFTGFAEFVALHYAMSNRNDTEYWKANNKKQWEECLINLKPRFQRGFVHAAISRNIDFRFPNDGGGLHAIAAGMNWAATDTTTLKYHNRYNDKEMHEHFAPWVERLEERKKSWNKNAEKYLNYIDWMKQNIYT